MESDVTDRRPARWQLLFRQPAQDARTVPGQQEHGHRRRPDQDTATVHLRCGMSTRSYPGLPSRNVTIRVTEVDQAGAVKVDQAAGRFRLTWNHTRPGSSGAG